MNNEIKEILDKLNNKAEHYILYNYEVKQLLDYITNLQEELQAYKKERENILDKSKRLNYKLRIDKAIEYIEKCDWNDWENDADFKIINILKGSDKE